MLQYFKTSVLKSLAARALASFLALMLLTATSVPMTTGCAGGSGPADPSVATGPQPGVIYYIDDHLGSSHLVTDSLGNVLREESRFPYGLERSSQPEPQSESAVTADYVYTGKEYDVETGLIYFGGRYYAPELGRWITPDPLFLEKEPKKALESVPSLNLYAYARNNPLTWIDPDGFVDLRIFDEAEAIHKYADKVESANGEYSIGAHGDPSTIVDQKRKPVTPTALAKQLTDPSSGYKQGQTVQLFSCETGAGKNPYAQQLANQLNAKVIAPDNYVWYYSDGKTAVAPAIGGNPDNGPDLKNQGKWITFYPQKSSASKNKRLSGQNSAGGTS